MDSLRSRLARVLLALTLPAGALAATTATVPVRAAQPGTGCQLNSTAGAIKHVIVLQFDNVHFRRANVPGATSVPSDIEQMPNLYNFLVGNGTVLNNHHTPLISHTGTDILTTLTGVYPDRHGQPVSNTFFFYAPTGIAHQALTFAYWTDLAQAFDGTAENKYNLVNAQGNNPPAPWVPFTRAGCNVGAVGTANIELERVANVATVYGPNSPEAQAAATNPEAETTADFIGVAVHCSQASAICASSHRGVPDLLPNEPGGYAGFNGLFGHKYVAPQISSSLPMTDLDGQVISDAGFPGFPGFNGMTAAVSLSYVAAMQEHNIPITYAYLSAVHEANDTGLGPGDPVYEQNLQNYDEAFGKFFARLAQDGINKSNTLFVVTADEGDHFVGVSPSNPGCDGVTTTCSYDPNKLGSVEVALDELLQRQQHVKAGFQLKGDSAPDYYVNGNPGPNDPTTRQIERAVANLSVTNPITGQTERLTDAIADRPTLSALHMVTSDPLRTPTFTQFDKPDYEGVTAPLDCSKTAIVKQCPGVETWHHGDIQPDISTTWLGLVGPGVLHLGVTDGVWSDHPDTRPTILALVGLRDDYRHDGRAILDALNPSAVTVNGDRDAIIRLGQAYKQLDATVGAFGSAVVKADTQAVQTGTDSNDSAYLKFENNLTSLTNDRDALALQISKLLDAAVFDHAQIDDDTAQSLIQQAQTIINRAQQLSSGS